MSYDESLRFFDSLVVTMPSEMNFVMSHKIDFIPQNTELCTFIQSKDHAQSGVLLPYLKTQ